MDTREASLRDLLLEKPDRRGPKKPPRPADSLGGALRQARIKRNMTQLEAIEAMQAFDIHMNSTRLSDIERDKHLPPPDLQKRLCRFYGIEHAIVEELPDVEPISKREARRIAIAILLSFVNADVTTALVTTSSAYDENLVESGYDPLDERIAELVAKAADEFVSLLYEEYYKEKK
jgi:transcriptional regulator with XRE-family HTH domain